MTSFARRRRSHRGQSLVEMAVLLPFLLALAGGATDLARAYQASITLESAVRNAAQEVATYSTDATDASTDAQRIVCLESRVVPGFTSGSGGDDTKCTAPDVTVEAFSVSTDSPGTTANPVGSATVHAELSFQPIVLSPFLPNGTWTLSATKEYSVLRGR